MGVMVLHGGWQFVFPSVPVFHLLAGVPGGGQGDGNGDGDGLCCVGLGCARLCNPGDAPEAFPLAVASVLIVLTPCTGLCSVTRFLLFSPLIFILVSHLDADVSLSFSLHSLSFVSQAWYLWFPTAC